MAESANQVGTVGSIVVYPLKSARGVEVSNWQIEESGLRLDRQWMLIDQDGYAITQLSDPLLTSVDIVIHPDRVEFIAPGKENVTIPLGDPSPAQKVIVHMDNTSPFATRPCSDEINEWFSHVLKKECRLVCCNLPQAELEQRKTELDGPVRFQNAYPIHLLSQSSLDDLNSKLQEKVMVDRFRPNLVIQGTNPHEDDSWHRIRIGNAILRIQRGCDHRCGLPNIDQQTGERSAEPLRTLAQYRRTDNGIMFGQNVVLESGNLIEAGDPVFLLSTKQIRPPWRLEPN